MKNNTISLSGWAGMALLVLGIAWGFSAHAQWGWTDKDGRRIFSDQGPTSDVPEKSIFKRPGGAKAQIASPAAVVASAATGTASASQSNASAPKLSGKDSDLEKKKKEAEAVETAKKKVEKDKYAALQAENCERAKKSKSTYSSGIRISTTNAKGEREIMSDADRAAEVNRLDSIVASDCK